MTLTLNLTPEAERALQERATQSGQTVEGFVQQLLEREAQAVNGGSVPLDQLSPAEFDRRLEELSEGVPPLATLPADFSRADLYADHD